MLLGKFKKKACIDIIGDTNIGSVRSNNQDYFYTPKPGDKITLAIVADGMGGYKGGDVASELCVNTIVRFINRKYSKKTDIEELLYESVNIANIAVYDRASESEYLRGMGTTLIMAAFVGRTVYVLNVGDSRAYHISADYKAKQITDDHTLVQEYINLGKITKEEAKTHNYRHVITRAIGTEKRVMVDMFKLEIKPGEHILLCSDGMYEYIEIRMIEKIMEAASDRKSAIKTLMDMSNQAGGSDNITVVIATNKESE
ncbi:MAG: Stp1/IreP family PP2C-type Ser/Thr phosphatase [Clostridia bacterium]|nr:Stp1/IreP family PP2C-type Ser/Thr phosphatase [Clostridia bacterium]